MNALKSCTNCNELITVIFLMDLESYNIDNEKMLNVLLTHFSKVLAFTTSTIGVVCLYSWPNCRLFLVPFTLLLLVL